jgi:hypothetical protein
MDAAILVGYTVNGQTVTAKFVHQIGVSKPSRGSPAFSGSGDSGSLIVTKVGFNPVGLLFAGNNTNTATFANPIQAVLTALNVSVDGN